MKLPLGHIDRRQPIERRHPLNVGLVSWWLPFGAWQGGDTLRDLCRRNNGTLTNGPTWTVGGNGFGAVQLDGTDDCVPVDGGPMPSMPFTLSVWCRPLSLSGNDNLFVLNRSSDGSHAYGTAFIGAVPNIYAGDGSYTATGSTASATVGAWHLVTGVFASPTSRTIYLDGSGAASSAVSRTPTGIDRGTLGAFRAGTPAEVFHGDLGAAWRHDRELSAAEVAALYDQARRGYPDLLRRASTRTWFVGAGASSPVTVTPTTAALTTTGYAPTIRLPRAAVPTTRALTLTTYAPTVRTGINVTPGTATLNTTGYAPTVRTPRSVTPTTRALSLTTYAPNVVVPGQVIPSSAALNLTGYPPTVRTPRTATPGPASLTAAGYAPTVRTPRAVVPGVRALVLTGFAPTVTAGTPTAPTVTRAGIWATAVRAGEWGTADRASTWRQ